MKHSSPYSQHLHKLELSNPTDLSKLQKYVRQEVGFHFAKFYVVLMPFYCGSSVPSVVFSMAVGCIVGFMLMWCVFKVHKKMFHHRNIVAFSAVFILIAISSLAFVRGIAWIQVVSLDVNACCSMHEDALCLMPRHITLGVASRYIRRWSCIASY